MKKDRIVTPNIFSKTLNMAHGYVSANLGVILLIIATMLCTFVLSIVQSVESDGASSSVNFSTFFSSVVYHGLLCALVFFFCSRAYFPEGFEVKEIAAECLLYLLTLGTVVFGMKYSDFAQTYRYLVLIPSAFSAFIVAIVFSQMSAVFFSIVLSLGVLNAGGYQLMPFLYTLATSMLATRIVRTIRTRSTMVVVALVQAVANVIFFEFINIIIGNGIGKTLVVLPGLAFNGFISAILCLGMLTPLEILLNTASPFRLLELSDMNSPILKRLFSTASGTYTHSIAVAQLAENACREINANALLARVASYYHDIGKLDNPEYFTENQSGEENLHDNLNPSLSVSIIRSHVRKGIEKARELRLPQQVIDIISEHHGNQVISFFYNEAKQKDPAVNPEDYSYNGRPPSTKESAVVMLADTVEAACRSLQNKSVPSIEKFVDSLVKSKLEHGQLDNSSLTFKEIDLIKKAFVQFLAGYYHSRIKYPDQKEQDSGKNKAQETEGARTESARHETLPALNEVSLPESQEEAPVKKSSRTEPKAGKKTAARTSASAGKKTGTRKTAARKESENGK